MKHDTNNPSTGRYHNRTSLLLRLMLCMLTLASTVAWSHADTSETVEVAEVKTVIETYAKSIDAADVTLASQIWLTESSVSFIHPRGHERGWEQVKTNFYQKTMGERFSERKLTIRDLVVQVSGDAAWAEFYWAFAAKMKADGSALNTRGRETQVLRKTEQGWRIVHVHYSGMPVTGERQGF